MTDSWPQLPEYDPYPNLWTRIEADLNLDEHLSRVVHDLPTHEPNADVWNAIEQELNAGEPIKIRPLWPGATIYLLGRAVVAAAVFVLVGIWLFLRPEATEDVRMEYAVEQTDISPHNPPTATDNPLSADKRAEEFIARQCAEQQLVCQRPEVHELRNQLASLTNEQRRIEKERQVFGDDPALVRAQVKIENQRAEVTKELITLLRS